MSTFDESGDAGRLVVRTLDNEHVTGTVVRLHGPKRLLFIAPDEGGPDLFSHERLLADDESYAALRLGDRVTFILGSDADGRAKAIQVRRGA